MYIAQPPLYSTEVGKEKIYLKDDAAKAALPGRAPEPQEGVPRLKGLGEMDCGRAARHHHGPGQAHAAAGQRRSRPPLADEIISVLMGDEVELRKQFIQQNAKDVRFLDI